MAYVETRRPISAFLVDLVNRVTSLVRTEGQLAGADDLLRHSHRNSNHDGTDAA